MSARSSKDRILNHLPSLTAAAGCTTHKGFCPFHADWFPTLVVQFQFDSARCLICGYAGSVDTLLADLQQPQVSVNRPVTATSDAPWQCGFPSTGIGYWLSEEISGAIYRHIFLGKVKELARAVSRLQSLIARMKR